LIANSALQWFCDDCREIQKCNTDKHKSDMSVIVMFQKLMDKILSLECLLAKKAESVHISELEARVRMIEDQSIASGVENKLTSLETRLDSFATQLKVSAPAVPSGLETENGISDEELIKSVVQEEIHKKTEEERDSENRRRNIIIYRVPEKKMDNISERKESDVTFVKSLGWCFQSGVTAERH